MNIVFSPRSMNKHVLEAPSTKLVIPVLCDNNNLDMLMRGLNLPRAMFGNGATCSSRRWIIPSSCYHISPIRQIRLKVMPVLILHSERRGYECNSLPPEQSTLLLRHRSTLVRTWDLSHCGISIKDVSKGCSMNQEALQHHRRNGHQFNMDAQ